MNSRINILRSTTEYNIDEGGKSVDGIVNVLTAQSTNYNEKVIESINTENEKIISRLNQIKYLAQITDSNINVCLENNESIVLDLKSLTTKNLAACVSPLVQQQEKVRETSKNNIRLFVNDVDDLYNQLTSCQKDLVCSSPVLCRIQSLTTDIPDRIQTELNRTQEHIDFINVEVQNCNRLAVGSLLNNAATVLDDINTCAQDIINVNSNP